MVNARKNVKKYFLPLYAIWFVVTPSIVTYMSGVLAQTEGTSILESIPWPRVISFFTLFGLIWPLTIVITPAFFEIVKVNTGLGFFEAFSSSGAAASTARLGYILFTIAWIGPLIHAIITFYYHKKDVSRQTDAPEKFGWIDYLAAFV